MRALFCCRAPNLSPPPEEPRIAPLAHSRPSSVISEIIHDDSTALQDIFGPTSSIRGYRAAAASSTHHPISVLTEINSTTRRTGKPSPRKSSPLKVRVRLSNSKLFKVPQKYDNVSEENHEVDLQTNAEASPRGLDDILADRSVSQGGYDSDAKNIDSHKVSQPPQPEESKSAGSIDVSPKYLAKVLTSLDGSTARTPSINHGRGEAPKEIVEAQRASPAALSSNDTIRDRISKKGTRRSGSSPEVHLTPTRPSRAEVIDIGGDESPEDALRRHNTKSDIPRSPVRLSVQAPRLPSLDSAQRDWKLSFAAPRRTSSLKESPERNQKVLPMSDARIEKLAGGPRESIASPNVDRRSSVISNLDDSLVAQMNSFWSSESPKKETRPLSLPGATSIHSRHRATSPSMSVPTVDSNLTSWRAAKGRGTIDVNSTNSAFSDPETKSIHLFNMRISQRLASNSLNPVRSPSISNNGTAAHTRHTSIASTKSPLSACVPGAGAATHMRQVSNTSTIDSRRLHTSWKTRTHIRDDSSSVYTAKDPLDSDSEYTHSRSQSNADRYRCKSIDGDFQIEKSRALNYARTETMSNLSIAGEGSWFRRNTTETFRSSTDSYRAREIEAAEQRHGQMARVSSTPKESKFVEDFSVEKSDYQFRPPKFHSQLSVIDIPDQSAQLRSEKSASTAALSQMSSQSGLVITNEPQESAADIWERTLKAARNERQFDSDQSWASNLDLPGCGYQNRTPVSTPGLIGRVNSSVILKSKKSIGGALNGMKYLRKTPPMSWARFPSHTRGDRNEHAGAVDEIETRDFSAPIFDVPLPQEPPRIQCTPKKFSWRLHKPKKSTSMTFTKWNARKMIHQYAGLFRSQSSDLRRLRAGHRSSISAGGVVEYPELEMIPGYRDQSFLGGAADGSGDDYRFPSAFRESATLPRKARVRESSRIGLLSREDSTPTPHWAKRISERTELDSLPRASRSTPNIMSQYSSDFGAAAGSATAWSRMYADCVIAPPSSSPTATRTVKSATDDYVSVTFSDRDVRSLGEGGLEGRLMSSELRNSTTDFKELMRVEENKAKEGLLRAVESFDQNGKDGTLDDAAGATEVDDA